MKPWLLPGLGAALLGVISLQARIQVHDLESLLRFVALSCAAIVFYGLAAFLILKRPIPPGTLGFVLVAAALMRVPPLASPPQLSTDLYRYIWDGQVQLAGINPYRFLPAAPELAQLRDPAMFPLINRAEYAPTIYPPVAQALFAAIAAVWPHPLGVKLAMLGFEALAVWAMLHLLRLAGLPQSRVLIYAWQPGWPWEYAGNGHVDAAALAFIGLALLAAARRRQGWAGLALAAAVMVKLLPAVIAPALWRGRGWRMPAIAVAAALAGYAAYSSAGLRVFGFLGGYAREEGLGSGSGLVAVQVAGLLGPMPAWAGVAWLGLAAASLGVLAWPMLRGGETVDPAGALRSMAADALLLCTVATAALSPHYAWYFGWLAYLACLAPWRCVLWLTSACVLLYVDPDHTVLGWSSLIYAPFLLLAIRDARRPLPV